MDIIKHTYHFSCRNRKHFITIENAPITMNMSITNPRDKAAVRYLIITEQNWAGQQRAICWSANNHNNQEIVCWSRCWRGSSLHYLYLRPDNDCDHSDQDNCGAQMLPSRAGKDSSRSLKFYNHREGPSMAFSWLKESTVCRLRSNFISTYRVLTLV